MWEGLPIPAASSQTPLPGAPEGTEFPGCPAVPRDPASWVGGSMGMAFSLWDPSAFVLDIGILLFHFR